MLPRVHQALYTLILAAATCSKPHSAEPHPDWILVDGCALSLYDQVEMVTLKKFARANLPFRSLKYCSVFYYTS